MDTFRRLLPACLTVMILSIAATATASSIIHFEFTSEGLHGDLAIGESPFVGWEFDPVHSGHYYTTASLTFGPIDGLPTVSVPSQDVDILIYQDLDACCQRFFQYTDELHLVTNGPYASYDFWFTQLFNPPGTGFLKSTSLSDPVPAFFPIECPSNTVPCRDGVGYSSYSWTFNGTRRNISFIEASVDTPVPEPGLAALVGVALAAWTARRRPRRR
jgi:hypothetical protein